MIEIWQSVDFFSRFVSKWNFKFGYDSKRRVSIVRSASAVKCHDSLRELSETGFKIDIIYSQETHKKWNWIALNFTLSSINSSRIFFVLQFLCHCTSEETIFVVRLANESLASEFLLCSFEFNFLWKTEESRVELEIRYSREEETTTGSWKIYKKQKREKTITRWWWDDEGCWITLNYRVNELPPSSNFAA